MSHDECVRECVVPDLELDPSGGIEVTPGVFSGLRSIFEMAVASQGDPLQEDAASYLTRTLGLHSDTPALAPFLGKEARRKEIKVWDTEEIVDIDGFDEVSGGDFAKKRKTGGVDMDVDQPPKSKPKVRWRMPRLRRNDTSPEYAATAVNPKPIVSNQDANFTLPIIPGATTSLPELPASFTPSGDLVPTISSRFHIAARVILADRSLWIAPGMRIFIVSFASCLSNFPAELRSEVNKDHTHKWMISVDSPSYVRLFTYRLSLFSTSTQSYHITTLLLSLTVTSLTDPSAFPALSTDAPPFVVIGTTDKPFLARVELLFNGAGDAPREGQSVVFEHWVDVRVFLCSLESILTPSK